MHEARQRTESMNLKQLNDLFNEGRHYIDYTLNEYEFCRYFLTQAKPKTIKVIGGFTNINLFYAVQDLNGVEVTNWDPGEVDMGSHIWSKMFDHYKQIFNFKGVYNWLPKTILKYSEIGDRPDLLWIDSQEVPFSYDTIEDWPEHIIMSHGGKLLLAEQILKISRHRPLLALGKRMAVFSSASIDCSAGTGYNHRPAQFLGKACVEIVK